MSEEEAFLKLRSIGQEHFLPIYNHLPPANKNLALKQILRLDHSFFRKAQAQLKNSAPLSVDLKPFKNYFFCGNQEDEKLGRQLVQDGKVALVVLAGGQGSRLKCPGPKGCCKVSYARQKSLYQLLAEKVKAASVQLGRDLEMAIMTSPLNHEQTKRYFADHANFGLNPGQLSFFEQQMWPLLNLSGEIFLDDEGNIAGGPNGNGSVFRLLVENGTLDRWHKMGVEMINILPIDNPLAYPFDFEFFGFHARQQNEVTVKVCKKRSADEKVGVLGLNGTKSVIVEYFELDSHKRQEKDAEGNLLYGLANLGLYCFSMPFVLKACKKPMPLHCAKKAVKTLGVDGRPHWPDAPNAWKFEEFLFDIFVFAEQIEALVFERASCFAPLKNLTGTDSIETVQEALLAFDRKIFAQITGNPPPPGRRFELAPQFYYPTQELLEKWRGEELPGKDYIDE